MVLTADCAEQFVRSIIYIVEEVKTESMKKEKGSLDELYIKDIRIIARAYLRLSEELLDKTSVTEMTNYLYFEFEKPVLEYLGFAMPKMLPY